MIIMGKKAYKPGLVSSILNASSPAALDPALSNIFGSNQYAVKTPQPALLNEESPSKKEKKKKRKLESNSAIQETPTFTVGGKKKLKKLKAQGGATLDTTESASPQVVKRKKKAKLDESSNDAAEAKETPKRKKMKKLINNEYDIVSRKKSKKGVTIKREAEDEGPKKGKKRPKVDTDNDKIISDFENEQKVKEEEDSDEEDDGTVDKKPASTTLKNFELNAPKMKDPEEEKRTVFVGNLPTSVKEKTVLKLFREFGKVEAIRFRGAIPIKPYLLKKVALNSKKLNPDQYNLTAYIRFKSREDAEKAAAEMNGVEMEKHHITVDLADNKKHDNKRAVFVGNLPHKIHEDELREFFSECGAIISVRVIRNAVTGAGKGFGYVNFQNPDSVELALKKGGESIDGRQIRVSRAVKKEKKSKEDILKKKAEDLAFKQKMNRKNAEARIARKSATDDISFTGDKRAESKSLKNPKKKPHKGDLKKAHIAAKLTGLPTTQVKKLNQKKQKKKF